MLSIFGMILFLVGIGGIGCAIGMFFSYNGGFLYWLSILIGVVCIPVTALGYVLMGEKERREKAKETKTLEDQPSHGARHEFVRITAGIVGLFLFVLGVLLFGFAVLGYMWSSDKAEFAPAVPIIIAISSISLLFGFLLLLWVFRGRKSKRKGISKG